MSTLSGTRMILAVLVMAGALGGSSRPKSADARPAPDGPAGRAGLDSVLRWNGPVDGISPAEERTVRAAVAAYQAKRGGSVAPRVAAPFRYPFFPHAGIPGRDLFLANFVDLDPSSGIRDWDCSSFTYDGHRGHDSILRSFREQAIGVPVFAALDGTVVATHDGEPDMNTEWHDVEANYVVIDHGNGYAGYYWHFRRGSVAVRTGQRVVAGTQIGLTGSSGISSLPHLHFGTWLNNTTLVEPSAGPCRSGESLWTEQVPVMRDLFLSDFYMADRRIPDDDFATVLLDDTPRTSTFVSGRQTVWFAVDLHNLPGGSSWRMRVVKPDGSVETDRTRSWGFTGFTRFVWSSFSFDSDLDTPGTWRLQFDNNGDTLIDAPFTVVTSPAQVVNRPPNPVGVRLRSVATPTGRVLFCDVDTSPIFEDPDYDIVSYRYQWKFNRRVVRDVTTAALSDAIPGPGNRTQISCRVTPRDVH